MKKDTPWEANDKDFPRKTGTCEVCGKEGGIVKQSVDQHKFMCIKAGPCIAEMSRSAKASREPASPVAEDLR